MRNLKNKILGICFVTLIVLNTQVAYACISNEYNNAYSLYKNSNYSESVKAFTNLYKNGCPTSPYFLGTFYAYGIGVKQDYDKAIDYFDVFLNKTNKKQPRHYRANSYLALAYVYKSTGQLKKANEYLIESAEIDNSEAMFLLGRSYINNKQPYYINANHEKAFFWLNKAASYGNVEAMKLIYQYNLQSFKAKN